MFEIDIVVNDDQDNPFAGERKSPVGHLALIGNALPRRCGLATFTSHVADALRARFPSMRLDHYAMDDGSDVTYPDDIRTIDAGSSEAYLDAAAAIEASGADAIWLQHEYGIFGGMAGSHIMELLGATDLPLILTFHTVLESPSSEEEAVLRRLLARADHVIVMADQGRAILKRRYGADLRRVSVIPHGVPDRPKSRPDDRKAAFGWEGRRVLMTFGLLAPDKGIRHMIEAMPAIVAAYPDVLYEVVGATHPNLIKHEGEQHRQSLVDRAAELGVADNVRFVDAFVEQEELLDMLQAADVYVTPYLNMAQVTSGTLSYAVSVGMPVVSTPYVHAKELLGDGTGVIVPKADSEALATAIIDLLSDDERRASIADAAYKAGRSMLWPRVVERALSPLAGYRRPEPAQVGERPVPTIPLDAIRRMSDGVGMLQHGVFGIADRHHGYCIDDNARALLAMVLRGNGPDEQQLASSYAAFVDHGWNADTGRFRNFMGFDRRWLEDVGSDDSNGRTLWAIGLTAARAPWHGIQQWAEAMFDRVAPHVLELDSPRTRAFAALGADEYLALKPGHDLSIELMRRCGEQLLRCHAAASRPDWNWFEPVLSYDNARLSEALIRVGRRLDDERMLDLGLSTLEWLVDHQTGPRGAFRPVGSNGFGREYAPSLAFDQQPLEAAATIDAAATAFAATGDVKWRTVAQHAFGWFFGDNDAGAPLADLTDGGCYDGLMASGINRNQGAESILALQLAALTMRTMGKGQVRAGQSVGKATETPPSPLSPEVHDSVLSPSAPFDGGPFAGRRAPVPSGVAG
ncbi:glycosyltransferase family 4 protein [Sphingomonas sp. LY29]|uniref:glycosyltransferase family 4 protein n=1 Tax=Sphingomonas sp. LY29 TaxID=3095341 RepID=UPI002D7735F0|nr:glycosyltransferase family 4 protein [Sphingomonas sp. LY29]WRP25157.1 glycosyltransferase family 4 protein [Sphingomonas sp. LY29]